MAYDEALAERIRAAVKCMRGVTEKPMFGGIAWMRSGHMFTGTLKNELMVRVGKEAHDAAVARPHARIMDFTGKAMRGFIVVAAPGVKTVPEIRAWAERGLAYAESLPPKASKKRLKASKSTAAATSSKKKRPASGKRAAKKR